MMIKTTFMMLALASLSLADPAASFDAAQKSLEQARKMESKSFYLASAKLYEDANKSLEEAQKEEAGYKAAEVARLLVESEASAIRTKNLGLGAPPPVVVVKRAEDDHSVPPSAPKITSSLDESLALIASPQANLRSRGEAPIRMVSRPVANVNAASDVRTVRTRFTPAAGAIPVAAAAQAPVRVAAPAAIRQVAAGPVYMQPIPVARPVAPRPAPMQVAPPTNGRNRFGR